MGSSFKTIWTALEAAAPRPRYARDVIKMPFDQFRDLVYSNDEKTTRALAESIYSGDAYILENGISPVYLRELKARLHAWGQATPSESRKVLDGCPDFHCLVDKPVGPPGGYVAIDHSYYLFRYNGDAMGVFGAIDARWRVIKVLSGSAPDDFEENIPSDGTVDRIQVIHYPTGAGTITAHLDPSGVQKVIFGVELTHRGEDFQTGGFYVVGQDRRKRFIEDEVELGSFVCVYPSVIHGVDIPDAGQTTDWSKPNGRWYMAINSVLSHHVKDRVPALAPAENEIAL